jgi:UDP-2,3-diacylglucosamine pyrophosphatase LpxH
MRVLVLSDLHLGSTSRLPDADGNACLLLTKGWDRVILLGDIFDMWDATMEEIADRHAAVLACIENLRCECVYIPGNHDSEFRGTKRLNSMVVAAEPYLLECGGTRFAFVHGDKYDTMKGPISRVANCIGNAADWVASKILGTEYSVQRKILRSFARLGTQREKYVAKVAEAVVADVGYAADVVVMGHTHWPERREIEGKVCFNSGDFGPEHLSWIEIADGQVELKQAT